MNQAIGGQLTAGGAARDGADVLLGQVVTDSRQVEPGDVFWALRGPTRDGASFVNEAFRRGAVAVVVDKSVELPEGHWAVRVEDTAKALRQWARWTRRRFTGTLIAVTGSVGKTTTRQMIHTLLGKRLTGTASPRNYNNHVGVPLSLLALQPHHDYAVLELGANRKGEIGSLAALCAPKVGVITQVGDAHLGGFGSRQGIADAKAELLEALPPHGRAVLGDDPWLRHVAPRCRTEITWVGEDAQCDVRASEVQSGNGTLSFRVAVAGSHGEEPSAVFRVPVWGRHHLTSALAAIAVGRMLGLDLAEMADVLAEYRSVPMRCEVCEIRGTVIIDDTYNSSPTAMRAALELVRDFENTGRRIVVSGDMGELGAASAAMHWQLGQQAVAVGRADLLIACGRFARHVVSGARSAGLPQSRTICCEDIEQAMPYLHRAIAPGDVVLVKGSRAMAMERAVEALRQYPQRRSA